MAASPAVLKDLLIVVEEIAAGVFAESWDNVGLMVGDPAQQTKKILVALDPTIEVLAEAESQGCDLLITHHPLIFTALKSVRTDHVAGRQVTKALKAGIAVIGCHTNLDKVPGGVNDVLASRLGLQDCKVLDPQDGQQNVGFGRIGYLANPASFQEFISQLLEVLGLPVARVAGVEISKVECVAVCGGSGAELAPLAMASGAQLLVTGEVKHSMARWAEDSGFCIIDAGHFATENLVVNVLGMAIEKGCAARGLEVEVCTSRAQSDPFNYYFGK